MGLRHIIGFILGITLILSQQTAIAKTKVKSASELPRITYTIESAPSELLLDKEQLSALAGKLETDVQKILDEYEIEDVATVKGYMMDLRNAAALEGDFKKAIEFSAKIRDMQDKPADKLTSGLSTETIFAALDQGLDIQSSQFKEKFKQDYTSKIKDLPWDIVQDNIESSKGSMEIYNRNLLLGLVKSRMDPGALESKQLDIGSVSRLVNYRVLMDFILPAKDVIVDVLTTYIAANRVEKPDIWEARKVDLTNTDGLTDVVVAIWDSGIDAEIFIPKGQMWKNKGELPGDGIDNDKNGWIDDLYGWAHNLTGHKTTGELFTLPENIASRYDELVSLSKGLSDINASVDSQEASDLKKYLSGLAPEEVDAFLLDLGYFGNYTHGTHVAGIAAEGNPAIKLMAGRITFDHKVIPDVPRLDETLRSVRASKDAVAYMQANGVRIVNMSWGGDQRGIEAAFEANGVGDDAEMRAEMAKIMFEYSYEGLVAAMASAPEILFIPAAGNSDEDVDFNKVIPSSIALENVLVAGAVDQAGDETGFTSYGRNVRVHANGFEVDSYIPGGKRQKSSGTSMSAPNVTNLAAKLLAIDPSLSPKDVISLILLGSDRSEDGRRNLINPKKSLALLKLKNAGEF